MHIVLKGMSCIKENVEMIVVVGVIFLVSVSEYPRVLQHNYCTVLCSAPQFEITFPCLERTAVIRCQTRSIEVNRGMHENSTEIMGYTV